jgi:hypothetical protein
MLDVAYSEPSGKTRKKILSALLNIHDSWHEQLKQYEEPYYLKIWLYEPFLTKSQVVCATGDFIEFYQGSFFKPKPKKSFPFQNYGAHKDRMEKIIWEYAIHEEVVTPEDIGEPFEFNSESEFRKHTRHVNRRINRHYRRTESEDGTEFFHTKYGAVWIGGY